MASQLGGEELKEQAEHHYHEAMCKYIHQKYHEYFMENLVREEPMAFATFEDNVDDKTAALEVEKEQVLRTAQEVQHKLVQLRAVASEIKGESFGLGKILEQVSQRSSAVSTPRKSLLNDSMQSRLASFKEDAAMEQQSLEYSSAMADIEVKMEQTRAEMKDLREEVLQLEVECADAKAECTSVEAEVPSLEEQSQDMRVELEEERKRLEDNVAMHQWYARATLMIEALGGFRLECPEQNVEDGSATLVVHQGHISLHIDWKSQLKGGIVAARMVTAAGEPFSPKGLQEHMETLVRCARETEMAQPGEGFRLLVREAFVSAQSYALRAAHVKTLWQRCLVNYRPQHGEVTLSMAAGVTACLKLSEDYPFVPGCVRIDTLTGVGGWTQQEMDSVRVKLNAMPLLSLPEVLDKLIAQVGEDQ
ncbi:unnamed protein product [Chrysoparadoxa australica]